MKLLSVSVVLFSTIFEGNWIVKWAACRLSICTVGGAGNCLGARIERWGSLCVILVGHWRSVALAVPLYSPGWDACPSPGSPGFFCQQLFTSSHLCFLLDDTPGRFLPRKPDIDTSLKNSGLERGFKPYPPLEGQKNVLRSFLRIPGTACGLK